MSDTGRSPALAVAPAPVAAGKLFPRLGTAPAIAD
ncbi:hypothetical protein J3E61_004239 [Mycobacterium sp. OAE908]